MDGVEVKEMDDKEDMEEEWEWCDPWGCGDGKPIQFVDEEFRSWFLGFLFAGGVRNRVWVVFFGLGFHGFLLNFQGFKWYILKINIRFYHHFKQPNASISNISPIIRMFTTTLNTMPNYFRLYIIVVCRIDPTISASREIINHVGINLNIWSSKSTTYIHIHTFVQNISV